jgi:hypothetical protein
MGTSRKEFTLKLKYLIPYSPFFKYCMDKGGWLGKVLVFLCLKGLSHEIEMGPAWIWLV